MEAPSEQLEALAVHWVTAWGGTNPADRVAFYATSATYIDHAFQIRRTGSAIFTCHWELWRTAIPDFIMKMEDSRIPLRKREAGVDGTETVTFSIPTVNKGTFVNELPNKRVSAKKFVFGGVVDFRINREGLIESVEEWYS